MKHLSLYLLFIVLAFSLSSCFKSKNPEAEQNPRVPYSQGPDSAPSIGEPTVPLPG